MRVGALYRAMGRLFVGPLAAVQMMEEFGTVTPMACSRIAADVVGDERLQVLTQAGGVVAVAVEGGVDDGAVGLSAPTEAASVPFMLDRPSSVRQHLEAEPVDRIYLCLADPGGRALFSTTTGGTESRQQSCKRPWSGSRLRCPRS